MDTLKLILAGSFATAASLRVAVAFCEALVGVMSQAVLTFLAGPAGMAVETLLSLVVGVVVARRIRMSEGRKSEKV